MITFSPSRTRRRCQVRRRAVAARVTRAVSGKVRDGEYGVIG